MRVEVDEHNTISFYGDDFVFHFQLTGEQIRDLTRKLFEEHGTIDMT